MANNDWPTLINTAWLFDVDAESYIEHRKAPESLKKWDKDNVRIPTIISVTGHVDGIRFDKLCFWSQLSLADRKTIVASEDPNVSCYQTVDENGTTLDYPREIRICWLTGGWKVEHRIIKFDVEIPGTTDRQNVYNYLHIDSTGTTGCAYKIETLVDLRANSRLSKLASASQISAKSKSATDESEQSTAEPLKYSKTLAFSFTNINLDSIWNIGATIESGSKLFGNEYLPLSIQRSAVNYTLSEPFDTTNITPIWYKGVVYAKDSNGKFTKADAVGRAPNGDSAETFSITAAATGATYKFNLTWAAGTARGSLTTATGEAFPVDRSVTGDGKASVDVKIVPNTYYNFDDNTEAKIKAAITAVSGEVLNYAWDKNTRTVTFTVRASGDLTASFPIDTIGFYQLHTPSVQRIGRFLIISRSIDELSDIDSYEIYVNGSSKAIDSVAPGTIN